ncbi:MAG: serine/threonine protein kinase [Candidatus Melainabacteria bacterium]|nr:MAG: serine/threonine protein kinase [Candidatus Melainabacteria bacterium]
MPIYYQERSESDTTGNQELFAPGSIVDGRYKILSLIGQGGMGTVYLCEHIYLGTRLALKVLDAENISSTGIRRFQQEAKLIVSIEHENIVTVHDFGVIADRYPFFTMDYLEGESLAAVLAKKGTFTTTEALPIVKGICAGLSHAHAHGVVHRDIKPSNIMIIDDTDNSDNKRVCLVDFGIAKLSTTNHTEEQSLTRTGEVFGSPLYMSPEQCAGEPVDERADIYSLGCVLFEMLSGTPPFLGATAFTTMVQHYTREKPPTLKEATLGQEFPQEIENIVAKMLSKEVNHRYQNLTSVIQDLGDMEHGRQPRHVGTTFRERNQKSSQDKVPIVFGALTAVVLVAAILLFWQTNQPPGAQSVEPPETANRSATSTLTPTSTSTYSATALATSSATSISTATSTSTSKSTSNPASTATSASIQTSILKPLTAPYDGSKLPSIDAILIPEHPEMLSRIAQPISSADLDKLLSHPDPDSRLDLRMRILTSDDLIKIGKTAWVEHFSAKGAKISNQALSNLTRLKLWNLNLNSSNFNDRGARAISKFNKLRILNLGNTEVSDDGIKEISGMKILEKLELDGTEITVDSLNSLRHCRSLNWLSLRSIKSLNDGDVKPLQSSKLQFLNIEDTAIGDKSVESITAMQELRTICIGESKISIRGTEALLNMKSLKNIHYTVNENINAENWKQLQAKYPKINFRRGMHQGDSYN